MSFRLSLPLRLLSLDDRPSPLPPHLRYLEQAPTYQLLLPSRQEDQLRIYIDYLSVLVLRSRLLSLPTLLPALLLRLHDRYLILHLEAIAEVSREVLVEEALVGVGLAMLMGIGQVPNHREGGLEEDSASVRVEAANLGVYPDPEAVEPHLSRELWRKESLREVLENRKLSCRITPMMRARLMTFWE